jgi:signal peptidase I
LVTDFYAYNAYRQRFRPDLMLNYGVRQREEQELAQREKPRQFGSHWVGDLAMECVAKVETGGGELMLKLVEGGHQFDCQFDLASGQAKLTIDDGAMPFLADTNGDAPNELVTQTNVQGTGTYRLRFANVDDQLRLWVNEKLVRFTAAGQEHPATYAHFDPRPSYSEQEAGDLYPARIGCRNASVTVSKLRVLRDIYYVAVNRAGDGEDYVNIKSPERIAHVFSSPETWEDSELFAFADPDTIPRRGRDTIEFTLHEDQFFPMGDNSPQSRDARLWANGQQSLYQAGLIEPDSCIDRDLLIGKAFLVYWPHGWYLGNIKTPFPFIPNVGAMGRIR